MPCLCEAVGRDSTATCAGGVKHRPRPSDRNTRNVAGPVLRLRGSEADGNTCRKALEPVEAVTIGMAIEELVKPKAEERQKEHGGTAPGKPKSLRANCPKCKQPEQLRTAAVAAAGVGMKRRSYEKAKAVMKSGNEEAIDVMTNTGKVSAAYDMVFKKPAKKRGHDGRSHVRHMASTAMEFAQMAISQLERIRDKDPRRDEAFTKVEKWISTKRSEK